MIHSTLCITQGLFYMLTSCLDVGVKNGIIHFIGSMRVAMNTWWQGWIFVWWIQTTWTLQCTILVVNIFYPRVRLHGINQQFIGYPDMVTASSFKDTESRPLPLETPFNHVQYFVICMKAQIMISIVALYK